MTPPDLFRSTAFVGVNLLTFLLYGAFGGTLFFLPLFMVGVHGYSATEAAMAFLPFVVVMSLFSRYSGTLADRLGARLPLSAGPAIVGLGFLLMARVGTDGSYWLTFFPAILAMSIGMVITVAPLTATVMAAVPDERGGLASGINNAVSRTAGLVSIALFGLIFAAFANQALAGHLAAALPAEAAALLDEVGFVFGNLTWPDTAPEQWRELGRGAGHLAFVAGFRQVALVSAGLAVAAGLVGWLSLGRQANPERRAGKH